MTTSNRAMGAVALLVALIMIASAVIPFAEADSADNGSVILLSENDGKLAGGAGSGEGISVSYQYVDNQHPGYYLQVDLDNPPSATLYCTIADENGEKVSDMPSISEHQSNFKALVSETPLESGKYTIAISSAHEEQYLASCDLIVSDSVTYYKVTVSVNDRDGGRINGVSIGENSVVEGKDLPIIIELNDGYYIDSVTCDGVSLSPKDTQDGGKTALYVIENVIADYDVVVTFAEYAGPAQKYKVTAFSDDNGAIAPEIVELAKGDQQRYTLTPNAGYTLKDLKVNGISVASDVTSNDDGTYTYNYVHNTDRQVIIEASFKEYDPSKTYTIEASAGSNGEITPSDSVSVKSGSDQTFTITPSSGYVVDKVLVDGKTKSLTGSNTYTFIGVTENHTISVTFKESGGSGPGPGPGGSSSSYTISATAGAGGSISPSGNVSVSSGSSKTFNFTPNTGYELDTLLVDGSRVYAEGNSYTFSNVTSNHTISVTFKNTGGPATNYTISASAGSGGKISPSGNVSVAAGESKTFTISADKGYELNSVTVNGKEVTLSNNSYTFSNVNTDQSISVSFKEISTEPTPSEGDDSSNTMYYILIAIIIIIILVAIVYLFMRSKH